MYRIDHILDRIKRRKIAFSKNDSIPLLESKNNDSIIDLTGEENITTRLADIRSAASSRESSTEKITKENIHKSTNVSIEKNITLHYEKIESS